MIIEPLPQGSIIGILGGGQLGRMLALAAARLGMKAHIFCPDAESPAFDVTPRRTVAAYDDEAALAGFAASVDVVTYEFENVPVATARLLTAHKPVHPDANALEIALLSPPDDPASRAWGAVAWNPAAQQGVLQIAHLRPPPAGQRYRLWLADTRDTPAFDGSVIVFGTADGAARMSFHSSRPLGATPHFVVRLENENAPPAAHAPIVLQTP